MLIFRYTNGLEGTDVVWHHMAKLIVVVSERNSKNTITILLQEFMNWGFFDVACVYISKDGNIQVENFISLLRNKISNRST